MTSSSAFPTAHTTVISHSTRLLFVAVPMPSRLTRTQRNPTNIYPQCPPCRGLCAVSDTLVFHTTTQLWLYKCAWRSLNEWKCPCNFFSSFSRVQQCLYSSSSSRSFVWLNSPHTYGERNQVRYSQTHTYRKQPWCGKNLLYRGSIIGSLSPSPALVSYCLKEKRNLKKKNTKKDTHKGRKKGGLL